MNRKTWHRDARGQASPARPCNDTATVVASIAGGCRIIDQRAAVFSLNIAHGHVHARVPPRDRECELAQKS
jgi:hypothetical protein